MVGGWAILDAFRANDNDGGVDEGEPGGIRSLVAASLAQLTICIQPEGD
jgi:hypothetical protein